MVKKKIKEIMHSDQETKNLKNQKFEVCFKRLEKIVGILEEGSIPLEESIKLYEEGIELARICMNKLTEAELRVKKLSKEIDDKLKFEDYNLDE